MSSLAACPGCLAAPDEAPRLASAQGATEGEVLHLSLPAIHCASCIAGVEGTLHAQPGVRGARVNLGLKRAQVTVAPGATVGPLIAALVAKGYDAQELNADALPAQDTEGRALLARIAVAGFAMMNVMVLSVAVWSGASETTREMFHWISAAIALPALAFAAVPFFTGAARALRGGRLNMDVPIALAIGLAAAMSVHETFLGGHTTWFDAALSLTFFLLSGRYLDYRARASARSAAAELTALEVSRTIRLDGATHQVVPVEDVVPGDRLWLTAGTRVPVDGVALDAADLDRSALTGESVPVSVPAGHAIAAGELVLNRPLTLEATSAAADSTLRRLAALVDVAETGRHKYTALADRAAALYAPVVHLLSGAAFLGWYLATGNLHLAISVAVATLIITCPCALGLAAPAVSAAFSGRLFRLGVLLKNATALERLAAVDTILLDKTGTLTTGSLDLPELDDFARAVAAALARASTHPVARVVAAATSGVEPAPVTDLQEVPGEGVHGTTPLGPVFLGKGAAGTVLRLPGQADIPLTPQETLRPGAAHMVADLRQMGLRVALVTGDRPAPAARIADALGVERVYAQISPEGKADLVADLAAEGAKVLMLGDGLNDTGALAMAHVSLSPASALDAARAASDVVLLSGNLGAVPKALRLARMAQRRTLQNFAIAIAYNCVAVPMAVAGLATPLVAAIAMSTSSITVVGNAVRKGRA